MATPGSGIFKLISPKMRIQSTDIQAAALWGVAGGTAALFLVQPFDWLKKTFFEKAEPEQNENDVPGYVHPLIFFFLPLHYWHSLNYFFSSISGSHIFFAVCCYYLF
ncbi:hypothetical protein ACJIZ3_009476 [Penstemon smallii]|uniref:Uncharacterized protein n=1 Tax=Penstemon smallii TaxID=265156 RepID=A0ABD3TCM2_9LAMI